MERLENLNNEKLDHLVKQIIGKNWHISPLTEIYSNTDPFSCYQEWDLHLDEIIDKKSTEHLHKRFTIYYFLHGTLEIQLIIILNIIKEGIESQKSIEKYELHEFF